MQIIVKAGAILILTLQKNIFAKKNIIRFNSNRNAKEASNQTEYFPVIPFPLSHTNFEARKNLLNIHRDK